MSLPTLQAISVLVVAGLAITPLIVRAVMRFADQIGREHLEHW